MIRIILAGEFRGSESSWYSLFRMFSKRNDNVAIYAGGPFRWQEFTIPHKFVQTKIDTESIFQRSIHCHNNRYISQWSALHQTYQTFKHEFADTDIVVKARNDLDVYDLFTNEVKPSTVHVPEKEFHMNVPFDIETVCNDQIVIGTKQTMDVYFDLPRKYEWDGRFDLSIEEIIRNYLRQQNINIETFTLHYTKAI